jgi:hypothetical protein
MATYLFRSRKTLSFPCESVYETAPIRALVRKPHFYEKVVKVKADVAAILKFFLPIPQIEGDMAEAAPRVPIGGMRKGGFSGAL